MGKATHVLGISCYYHDSAAALIRDGRLVAAAQEERFNRDKYSNAFPVNAINYCLQEGNCSIYDVDHVAFYEKPFLKLSRVLVEHLASWPGAWSNFASYMPAWLQDRLTVPLNLERDLGYKGDVVFLKHHLSHAACAFYGSPFDEAAILTVDGVGEWACSTWGTGRGNRIQIAQEMVYPNSLGLLYSVISTFLGFKVFEGEGKVMALAAFGKPTFKDAFQKVVQVRPDGSVRLDPSCFALNRGDRMYSRRLVDLLGEPRAPESEITERHKDIAATLQDVAEEALLAMVRHVHAKTGLTRLAAGGGVFLNVVTNSRILRETPMTDLYVPPPAGDAGTAIGAAWYVSHGLLDLPRSEGMRVATLGPSYSSETCQRLLRRENVPFQQMDDDSLSRFVAQRIAEGQIVAWFRGRMEMGPRALGARSILADVRNPDMKEILNRRVKHREWFRPYGVAVLLEEVGKWCDLDRPSPYMLLVGNVPPELQPRIPSAIHVDGTTRLQTVTLEDNGAYYKVVKEFFALTGVPMIINTSFNVREPIVCTPEDALSCFRRTDMDWLVMEDLLVARKDVPPETGPRAEPSAPPSRKHLTA